MPQRSARAMPVIADDALLARIDAGSPFLRMIRTREADWLESLDRLPSDPLEVLAVDPDWPVARRLRVARRRLALLAGIGDLAGRYSFEQVTGALTRFADHALDTAIRTAIAERTGVDATDGFVGIALGKQGSGELNYSSDIDPILLYDLDLLPRRAREEPAETAVRVARRAAELLQARDGDGYVLRVDLRLRPSPEATPIALPVDAAIGYYESQALPWERAAFIRARAAAGDLALGERFLSAVRPFVWRRALDYGAIAEIRAITQRIRDHYAQGQAFGPGHDLKRGRGGIREIEFFAQVHQLIHGGRDPDLRAPATLDALARLAAAGWIGEDERDALSAAYRCLRTVEHRLQMVDDRQTHVLPPAGDALDNVARLHGLGGGAALLDQLRPHVDAVGRIYDGLATSDPDAVTADPRLLASRLADAGWAEPEQAVRRIEAWRGGSYPSLRSAAARDAMEAALPGLIAALAESADPARALARLDAVLARLPSVVNLFRLLEAQPALARLLAAILAHAPVLADSLAGSATLLDGLIDASAFDPVDSVDALAAEMRRGEADDPYERVLDRVRLAVHEKRFALGAQLVACVSDPIEVAGGYARVAEAATQVLASAAIAEFERVHGRVPDSELLILALGRLGGAALTHASDLDLVYCFSGDYRAESDGAKPLGAVLYYNRLAQRVTAALSVPTASGPLYPVDTRLRPSGAQGPLVVSLDGFARYQREDAWTWEHMALTRARPIFGSDAGRAALAGIVANVLNGARPDRDVAADARAMRAEMLRHKPGGGVLDAKLSPGGLVTLEFCVHVTQLVHRTGLSPDLGTAIAALVGQGLLPAGMDEAYRLLTRLLVAARLIAPDGEPPSPASRALLARAVGAEGWEALLASLDDARQQVSAAWKAIAGDEDAVG